MVSWTFLVDITHELNVLNKKLQGQGQLVSAAYEQRESILHKTYVMESLALSDKLLPFPSMQSTRGCRHTIQPYSEEQFMFFNVPFMFRTIHV